MLYGILNLSFWGYVIATLIMVQITIAAVTVYLHRHQAHRALELHPAISHFFRLWLWLTTGMVTRKWVAIHRKHHATCETKDDPHSPIVMGLSKVLWQGAELYRDASKDEEMVKQYDHGTPKDWMEQNIYSKHSAMGILIMFIADLILFGIPGITIWAVQMMWIPFFAAGVINGIGHFWGYRNFECPDAATNIVPIAIFIGGEELHNNHHTFASSAKLSVKWWEFDIGWLYIKTLSLLGLAKVKKLPQEFIEVPGKQAVDLETVRAVIGSRFQVMERYYKDVVRPVFAEERAKAAGGQQALFQGTSKLLVKEESLITTSGKQRLLNLLDNAKKLKEVYDCRIQLQQVWTRSASSQKDLIEALQNWVNQANASGIESLRRFAVRLQTFAPKVATEEA